MLKISRFIIFISISFSLLSCDIFLEHKNSLYEKIDDIKLNSFKKVSEIIEGEWEYICILRPYHGGISGLDERKTDIINNKISQSDLIIDEGSWHFILSKDEKFHAISSRRSRIDVQQINFSQKQISYFKKINFSTEYCPDFNEAAIFKFQKNEKNGTIYRTILRTILRRKNIRTYIT